MARMLQRNIPNAAIGRWKLARFANKEMYVLLTTPVKDQPCLIVGSIAPPDERLLSIALLAHTLKKDGASRVSAFFPYLAYCRHDKMKPGESLATGWTGSVLRASGIDEVVTADLHSVHDQELYPMALASISTADLFAREIKRLKLQDATIVAPDHGAIERCRAVEQAAGMTGGLAFLEKVRTLRRIAHVKLVGSVGERAVIVDDQLDTGATLVSACAQLQKRGVKEITIFVTHGLFNGETWKKLWSHGVTRIFVTDTIPKHVMDRRITVLSIAPLIYRFPTKPGTRDL
jgi:ribose-phosphate pyrophosphokinase